MRVLASAYACDPHRGSEPGVGWKWSLEIARRGHQVWVITRRKNAALIEQEVERLGSVHIKVIPYDLPTWARFWKRGARGVQIYYALWQIGAFFCARSWHRRIQFDLVHHLTFGVFRTPGWMWCLGVPFVLGPVGGAEFTPRPLTKGFRSSAKLIEFLRKAANYIALLDPSLWGALSRARWVYTCTHETRRFLPRRFHSKIDIEPIIGADSPQSIGPAPAYEPGCLELLFVGRLIHWKGLDFALKAVARARERHPGIKLTILGKGREQEHLQGLAGALDIESALTWVNWIEEEDLNALYARSHAVVFPSLHESGGLVVFEALQRAVPVLCLKIGGPAMHVNSERGACIEVDGRTEQEVVQAMADTLIQWAAQPNLLEAMRQPSHAYCEAHQWSRKVARVYEPIEAELKPN